ncbi:MAG: M23 family metallopeptidase [Coriobacteriia bacterium]|nr:M23 family metallopeptidase [Coriobacteriia bacterium]
MNTNYSKHLVFKRLLNTLLAAAMVASQLLLPALLNEPGSAFDAPGQPLDASAPSTKNPLVIDKANKTLRPFDDPQAEVDSLSTNQAASGVVQSMASSAGAAEAKDNARANKHQVSTNTEDASEEQAAQYTYIAYGGSPPDLATDEQLARVNALDMRLPFESPQELSSPYGPRYFDGFHHGIDWNCPIGTPVLAVADGTVIVADIGGALGIYTIIAHEGGVRSIYMHNSSLNVNVGQEVSAGEVIAYSGCTGFSTGPHLHLQIEVDTISVDPQLFITSETLGKTNPEHIKIP